MKTKMLLIAAAFVLTGCAELRAGWGDSEKVLSSDADTIELQWSSWRISEAAVRARAVSHCNGRHVEEVEAHTRPDTFGIVRSKTWRCVGASSSPPEKLAWSVHASFSME
jgi:hypothetical protein